MINSIITKIKDIFNDLDKQTILIIKKGLYFCSCILFISLALLITYLFYLHTSFMFKIGILTFEISFHYATYFIITGIIVDSLKKQII